MKLKFLITHMNSDEEMIKTKDVNLDEFFNFVVDEFFIWNHLLAQNSIWSSQNLKFKFQIIQTKCDGEMSKTKVIDIEKLCNFVVDNFFIWNYLLVQNAIWN